MKQLYILFTLVFCSQSFMAQMPYYQYFDGANTNPANSIIVGIQTSSTNIWQIGKPQKTLFSSASTTPNVIVTDTINKYPVNNVSTFTFAIKNPSFPSPAAITAIRWKQKLDMDQGLDGGIVEYSTNSGVTWVNSFNNPNVYMFYGFQPANKDTLPSGEFCFSGTDNNWRDIWLCLGPSVTVVNDTIMLRYKFKSDSVNTLKEGWMMDNFMAYFTMMHPVKSISQEENLVVYPNTTSGILNVETKKHGDKGYIMFVELYDMSGKLLESYGQNSSKVVLDISKYPDGLYNLRVVSNAITTDFPVVLQKN
jgi:hypothetical protein